MQYLKSTLYLNTQKTKDFKTPLNLGQNKSIYISGFELSRAIIINLKNNIPKVCMNSVKVTLPSNLN